MNGTSDAVHGYLQRLPVSGHLNSDLPDWFRAREALRELTGLAHAFTNSGRGSQPAPGVSVEACDIEDTEVRRAYGLCPTPGSEVDSCLDLVILSEEWLPQSLSTDEAEGIPFDLAQELSANAEEVARELSRALVSLSEEAEQRLLAEFKERTGFGVGDIIEGTCPGWRSPSGGSEFKARLDSIEVLGPDTAQPTIQLSGREVNRKGQLLKRARYLGRFSSLGELRRFVDRCGAESPAPSAPAPCDMSGQELYDELHSALHELPHTSWAPEQLASQVRRALRTWRHLETGAVLTALPRQVVAAPVPLDLYFSVTPGVALTLCWARSSATDLAFRRANLVPPHGGKLFELPLPCPNRNANPAAHDAMFERGGGQLPGLEPEHAQPWRDSWLCPAAQTPTGEGGASGFTGSVEQGQQARLFDLVTFFAKACMEKFIQTLQRDGFCNNLTGRLTLVGSEGTLARYRLAVALPAQIIGRSRDQRLGGLVLPRLPQVEAGEISEQGLEAVQRLEALTGLSWLSLCEAFDAPLADLVVSRKARAAGQSQPMSVLRALRAWLCKVEAAGGQRVPLEQLPQLLEDLCQLPGLALRHPEAGQLLLAAVQRMNRKSS